MRFNEQLIPRIGDILALLFVFPFFIYYFYNIENRSDLETYLLVIAFLSFIADFWFTVSFFCTQKNNPNVQ